MSSPSEERRLGEYRTGELVFETERSWGWLAEQESVGRRVLVEELKPGCEEHRAAFLADVRAKAAVEHPLVGSVYEAVSEAEQCYAAFELLSGATLRERLAAREPFEPGRLTHILRRITEAEIQHESLGQSTAPLGLGSVHVDDNGVIRLDNLAVDGTRAAGESVRDVVHLGETMGGLVADGRPGATRLFTLLGWMRGEGIDAPISWQQVREYCLQIEQQLAEPDMPTPAEHASQRRAPAAIWVALGGLVALGVVVIAAIQMRPPAPKPSPAAALPDAVAIPAGDHPTPDGAVESLEAFRISSHEVTIGEYAGFLDTLDTLTSANRERTFDHESQPADKTSHRPDDWDALLAAAKAGGMWNGRPVTLGNPVVGIDWWDAAAYAEWKHARLPTQEEWFAALRLDVEKPAAIPPSSWVPVTAQTTDRTPLGILGMAGSVAEWTLRPALNPTNPLGERKWLLIGGSYLKPGSNALSREWIDERSLRRPDLGFRLVFDADPS